jgi:dinuclear metal center YbgI/SA1388 family protein
LLFSLLQGVWGGVRVHRGPKCKDIMKLSDLSKYLDAVIPLSFQEGYDNSGLQAGLPGMELTSALLTIDITEEVITEAIKKGCNLVISHHPLIFTGIKKLTGGSNTEKILAMAIKADIAIYSAHTNLDAMDFGVSRKMAQKLNLKNVKVLMPLKNRLLKLVTFIPEAHLEKVRNALFEAGAGVIGDYDQCGFIVAGKGSFRAGENANPFVGEIGTIHSENEIRLETVLFSHLKANVIKALLSVHPYEEVAFDIYPLENDNISIGTGCSGEFDQELTEKEFLNLVASVFEAGGVRYSRLTGRTVKNVALCGGSGASLISNAISAGADAFVTADIKYHSFFDADDKILLVDAGHFESEKFTSEILYEIIMKKFPKFAVRFSETNTNPINYL